MADVREQILTRLMEVAGQAGGGVSVKRNLLPNDDMTAYKIVLIDGDEEASETDPVKRPPAAPRVIRMHPMIMISALAKAANVGSDLSVLRAALIKAIENDAGLTGLTLNGQGGRYVGIESHLALGIATLGQMILKFRFTYVLKPSDLS